MTMPVGWCETWCERLPRVDGFRVMFRCLDSSERFVALVPMEHVELVQRPGESVYETARRLALRDLREHLGLSLPHVVDSSRFPSTCPRCGRGVYVGLLGTDHDGPCR